MSAPINGSDPPRKRYASIGECERELGPLVGDVRCSWGWMLYFTHGQARLLLEPKGDAK